MSSRLPFVLAATDQGTLIVNRFDYHADPELNRTYGIGLELLDTANYEASEREAVANLLRARRIGHGDGVVALDVGANIGAHTVAWARVLTGWGSILAFEPQEWCYYALAGNLAINNCLNARAFNVAVGSSTGTLNVPVLDPSIPYNFGGLELVLRAPRAAHQLLGNPVDRTTGNQVDVIPLDMFKLKRVDLMKIDVEGMEIEALIGARELLREHKPILFIEYVKSPLDELVNETTNAGYGKVWKFGMNIIAIHPDDPCHQYVKFEEVENAIPDGA